MVKNVFTKQNALYLRIEHLTYNQFQAYFCLSKQSCCNQETVNAPNWQHPLFLRN
jgi:hypothetical protein